MLSYTTLHQIRLAVTPLAIACAVALTACGGSDTAGRQPLGAATTSATSATSSADTSIGSPKLPLAAINALDAGNAAYRAKKFDDALARYREATVAAPNHAAPWFGLYMVANELKNASLADSAMRRVKALSADPATLTAHAEVTSSSSASGGTLPAGHPTTQTVPSAQPLPSGHPTATPALPPDHPVRTKAAPPKNAADSAKGGRAL